VQHCTYLPETPGKRGRKPTKLDRRNTRRRERYAEKKLTGPLATGAPVTSNTPTAIRRRQRRRDEKNTKNFFSAMAAVGANADETLESLLRSSEARKRSETANQLQAYQKIGRNVTATLLQKPSNGKNAPHRTGLAAVAMEGVPVSSRVAVGFSPQKAKEAGRTVHADMFRAHLEEHMRKRGKRTKIHPAEDKETVGEFKRACPPPSGATGAQVHQMTMGRMKRYEQYRSNYPDILKRINLELGEPEVLDLSKKLFRDILAVRLGCRTVEPWAMLTQAEHEKEVPTDQFLFITAVVAAATGNSPSRTLDGVRDGDCQLRRETRPRKGTRSASTRSIRVPSHPRSGD
jgi:hypothetical protein